MGVEGLRVGLDTIVAEGTVYEGFERPDEEHSYWAFLRGEIPISALNTSNIIYQIAAENMAQSVKLKQKAIIEREVKL